MELNANFSERVAIHADGVAWTPSPMPGVDRRMLDRIGGEIARATSIVRYAPNSKFSPHVHTGGEEFVVLEGVFQDEHGDFPAGSYIRNPPDERICIVAVGGSGVGSHLIKRVLQSWPMVHARLPDLRMIVVAGPRIDPKSLNAPAGVEVRAFVPDLDRHLAACDLALVQGGLTTCMELTAAGTPFLYFPLKNHFEQNFHVAHRLDRYGAGTRMEFATSTPDMIADAMVTALKRPAQFKPVESDGAARAALMLSGLI
jgi:predicted glycosyltransferase